MKRQLITNTAKSERTAFESIGVPMPNATPPSEPASQKYSHLLENAREAERCNRPTDSSKGSTSLLLQFLIAHNHVRRFSPSLVYILHVPWALTTSAQ